MTKLTNHVVSQRDVAVCTPFMFELQERLRKHGQQHNPRWIPTSSSTLAQLVSARWVALTWPSLWPARTGTVWFPLTNAPQPRPRERPTEPCDVVLQARDMFFPSGDVPPVAQRHLHSPPGDAENRHSATRHQRGVDCQLSSPEEGQSVRQDFHAPLIRLIWSSQVEIAKHRTSHDSASCFPADARLSTLHRKAPSSQDPCSST